MPELPEPTEQPPARHDQPGYWPPVGYVPPQPRYGPPLPAGYVRPAPSGERTVNVLAVLGVVAIFVFMPLALVLGLIARSQIKQNGQRGLVMAWAGIIAGGAFIAVLVGVMVFVVILMASGGFVF